MADRDISTSLAILGARGPMTIRELTGATAKALGVTVYYDDVDAVMRRHAAQGFARCDQAPGLDYREDCWTAVTSEDAVRRCGRCGFDEAHPHPGTAEEAMCETEGGHRWEPASSLNDLKDPTDA